MKQAEFRFYADLNDFLSASLRYRSIKASILLEPPVKDMIEAFGVPHPEVDLILVNSQSVDFSYLVQDSDRVGVYPAFRSLDVASVSRVRPKPLETPRFVLDVHLGRLARYLRMLGFDALYQNDYADETLADISSRDARILLTRDRGLLKRTIVTYGYCLRTTKPRLQLIEVLHRFDLFEAIDPFRRCLQCNGLLQSVAKASVLHLLPPNTQQYYHQFHQCPSCQQIYWPGSHYQRMLRFISKIQVQSPTN